MDADLSHPPEKVPELIAGLQSGQADFVIGSRYVPGASMDAEWGLFRWLNSKVATLLALPLVRVKDPMSGFFALRRDVFLAAGDLSPIGYKIGLELLVKTGCTEPAEIPIHFANRTIGESKLSVVEQLKYLAHLGRLLDYKRPTASRFVRFCLVGGTVVVVDLATLNLMLYLTGQFKPSRAMAIAVAMTWNFVLNRRFTFSHARHRPWPVQYARFVGSCALGAVVNWLVSTGLVAWDPHSVLWIQVSALAGIASGTTSNFLLAYYLAFPETGATGNRATDRSRRQ